MSQALRLLEFLDDLKPQGECDDCLSTELDVQPRQTVNQICRALAAAGRINRERSSCVRCDKVKITNVYRDVIKATPEPEKTASTAAPGTSDGARSDPPIDIEKARTDVVRICRALWDKDRFSDPPRGLAAMIAGLRNREVIPSHIANMMLTVSGLRNVYVYEGLQLRSRELNVAVNAWAIVNDWWSTQPSGMR